jgi:uncharacterized protein (DUF885 family)
MNMFFLWMFACVPKTPTALESATTTTVLTSTHNLHSEALHSMLEDHWAATMKRWPMWATELGDRRYDDKLPDTSPQGWAVTRKGVQVWRDRVATINPDKLNESEHITLEFFDSVLVDAQQQSVCLDEQWKVSPRSNAFGSLSRLTEIANLQTPEGGGHLLARYQAIGTYIDGHIDNLRLGLASERTPNAESLRRTIEMLDSELAKPTEEWRFLDPVRNERPSWTQEEKDSFEIAIRTVNSQIIRPAFRRYRDFLNDDLMALARPTEKAGVLHLPNGAACYQAAISHHTTLEKSADELHQTGLDALAGIHDEFRTLGDTLWSENDLQQIFHRLRTDKELFFSDSNAVVQKAESSLRRAESVVENYFGILPKAPCVVTPIPDFEAPYSTIAYYRPPRPDGSVPGQYFINKFKPETRPIHEAEVLAFHEAVPGHHLQLAIAQEQASLPQFRKHFRATAYTEGWALYTERLADEMGLYSGDIDRLGMLSFDAWRAARLVVDTGLHAKGWSRAQAIEFMLKNTPLAPNNIENEVDRYLSWPGQGLAYKTGQIEVLRLRSKAQEELGTSFNIKAWHDAVLQVGAVPLPVLEAHLDRWLEQQPR